MRNILAVCLLLAACGTVRAHFIWLVPAPGRDGSAVTMIFSDTLQPDENVPVKKIGHTKLFARGGPKGDPIEVKATEAKDSYRVTTEAPDGVVLIGGVCQYGVITKGKGEPFLLMYYPKTVLRKGTVREVANWAKEGTPQLPLEIVAADGKKPAFKVLWRGKPAAGVEVALSVPGVKDVVEVKTDANGLFDAVAPKAAGPYGMRASFKEAATGELDGKKYKEVRHHATFTMFIEKNVVPNERPGKQSSTTFQQPGEPAKIADNPAATKLLADARAARAVWKDFPGFSANITVNQDGKLHKGKVEVAATGKASVTLDADADLKTAIRREIVSLVMHRMPGPESQKTPCAFADDNAHHPLGRAIRVLNDELHSSYRIRDRQIIEVNRQGKDERFTITVLDNVTNADKLYLPRSYVVSTWDVKTGNLVGSSAHHDTWTRVGGFDLPESMLLITSAAGKRASRQITFSNVKLNKAASVQAER